MKHYDERLSAHYNYFKGGLRCGISKNISTINQEYGLRDKTGRKGLLNGYWKQRNNIGCASLGDKSYKSSIYSPDFFAEPGMVPGSTNNGYKKRNFAKKKEVDFTISKEAKMPFYETILWKDKVKYDRLQEELNDVSSLKTWEEAVLKVYCKDLNTEEDGEEEDQGKKGGKDKVKKQISGRRKK